MAINARLAVHSRLEPFGFHMTFFLFYRNVEFQCLVTIMESAVG